MVPPWRVFHSLWIHRSLLSVMIKRDVLGRYKGSALGLAWSLFYPILTLVVYTLVFGGIFGASRGGGQRDYAVVLFSGMILFLLFSECVNRASTLIILNMNYVKRVVFPLEILPWVALGSAAFHFIISTFVLICASLLLRHTIAWTAIFFPLPLLCVAMLIMGITWFLSALGVYLRDMAPTITILTSLMMFLSPVFYKLEDVRTNSPRLYSIIRLNPLTFLIDQMRAIFIREQLPNFLGLLLYFIGATLFAWIGLMVFQKLRKGFADVI